MKYASTVLITLLLVILAVVSFLHAHAADHSFSLTSIPKVEKGMRESQRYVQYINCCKSSRILNGGISGMLKLEE